MTSSLPMALIADCQILAARLGTLARAGELSPERLVAITDRISHHLEALREQAEEEDLSFPPLPRVSMRFKGRFGVIDGGLER